MAFKKAPHAASPKATPGKPRVFKTKHFSKQAFDAGIGDAELCKAVDELVKGQGDPLGGNVWKKRLNNNLHRSIVLTKTEAFWIYVYLFAKSDRENIKPDELVAFKKLAKDYGKMSAAHLQDQLSGDELKEICGGNKK